MNTHRFRCLLIAALASVLLAVLLTLWGSSLPANAQVWPPSSPDREPVGYSDSLARLEHVSAITFTPAFTVYLPAVAKDFGSPPANPCGPGQIITDLANDVSLAHIDVTALSTTLNGGSLQATFHIRDVPSQLTFNRMGVPKNRLEYEWSVYVDVDNNPQTGSGNGTEYSLSAMHFVFQPDSPTAMPIGNGVQVNTWRHDSTSGSWHYLAQATLTVDSQSDTMILTGNIPGIKSGSRLLFETFDYNPGGTGQAAPSSCGAVTGLESPCIELGVQQEANEIVQCLKPVREQ